MRKLLFFLSSSKVEIYFYFVDISIRNAYDKIPFHFFSSSVSSGRNEDVIKRHLENFNL